MSSEPKNHWERYVTPKLPELVKKLEPSLLLAELRACGLLTSEDCSTLRHECSKEEDRSRKLLFDILPRRGNDAFDRFCHVIGKVDGQRHILKEVLQVETMTKPSCKEDEKTPPQKGTNESTVEAPAHASSIGRSCNTSVIHNPFVTELDRNIITVQETVEFAQRFLRAIPSAIIVPLQMIPKSSAAFVELPDPPIMTSTRNARCTFLKSLTWFR